MSLKKITLSKATPKSNPNPFARRQLSKIVLRGELNELASLTVPDQDLTLRQLIDNHTRGIGNVASYQPVYNGDEIVPHPKSLDLTDLDEIRRRNAEQLEKARHGIREAKRAATTLEKLKQQVSQPANPAPTQNP